MLISAQIVLAAPDYGQDFLALQYPRFQANTSYQFLPANASIGMLDTTFGTDLAPVKAILGRIKPKYLRVHFFNGPCVRNGNCGSYEPVKGYSIGTLDTALKTRNPGLMKKLKDRVKLYCDLIPQYPYTTFLFSPVLEHNLSQAGYRAAADAVLSVCPGVQLVNSGMSKPTDRYKGAWLEDHGDTPRTSADIGSPDGTSITDMDIDAYKTRTNSFKVVFAWERVYNCRTNSAIFTDPRKRTACPKERDFELLAHILDHRPAAPVYGGHNCARIRPFSAPFINKPMAEDTGSGDPRANLPVVIMSPRVGTVTVHASDGKEVGKLGYYGSFSNMWRYYSGQTATGGSNISGYQFQARAKALTGSPYVWFKAGNDCYGPVLMGARAGAFR